MTPEQVSLHIGHGVDAHRLIPDRPLMLGCRRIDFGSGLLGHSDGDVVAHALGDALLGGAGLGDLGRHFPSTDPAWRDLSGTALLQQIAAKLHNASFALVSAQVIAIAQKPRLQPYLSGMAEAMAEALSTDRNRIVVTATTTDGMGFTGRGEGIAATAVALLRPL